MKTILAFHSTDAIKDNTKIYSFLRKKTQIWYAKKKILLEWLTQNINNPYATFKLINLSLSTVKRWIEYKRSRFSITFNF